MEEIITKSGSMIWLMAPIVLCSVFALSIILERMFFYLGIKVKNRVGILAEVIELARNSKVSDAIKICQKTKFYATNILKAGLGRYQEDKEVVKEAMENSSLYEIPKLERNLNFLSTIAHVSPLLGLLGTVMGMVRCFYIIDQKTSSLGLVNPSDLAGGIWIALLTTAAGLCVAIPSYIMYNYFIHKVNLATLESERAATELLESIPTQQGGC